MRYGIIEHHEDGADTPHPYIVVDSQAANEIDGMLGPKYTEAQAMVIAWAFSEIASGAKLYSGHDSNDILNPYTGPTRGIG